LDAVKDFVDDERVGHGETIPKRTGACQLRAGPGRTASFELVRNCGARIPVVWGARRERCSDLEPTAGRLDDSRARPTKLAAHSAGGQPVDKAGQSC
jgi:hypothetical protein